jgi:glycosyltransferase involved in cell wall biosynthesis
LKIALLTRRYPPLIGGAEKMLRYLAEALAALGNDVTVLTSRLEGLAPIETHGGLTVVRLATSRLRFLGTWLYMRNLGRWLATNPVDIAYVSMLKHDAYVAIGAGKNRGFPVVLRPEGAGATGDIAWQGWGRFGRAICQRCKQANAIVSISTAISDELRQAGYDASKIVSLPNGVPVPKTSWSRRPDWRAAPRAVFVGRLAPEKALETLVEAWAIVRSAFPGANLTLIGEGPERGKLVEQIGRLGLQETIELPGSVNDPEPILRGSDLFVLPSREEGMSIALLEAMALGIPLVATSIPGNRRLVQDFKHGRLVPPDDPSALAKGIVDQWSTFDRAFQMTRAARKRVIDEFSIDAVARKHMALFERLMTPQPSSPLSSSSSSC